MKEVHLSEPKLLKLAHIVPPSFEHHRSSVTKIKKREGEWAKGNVMAE